MIKRLANHSDVDSLSYKLRKKRFEIFLDSIKNLRAIDESMKAIDMVDIGGTQKYWVVMGLENLCEISITLVNLERQLINQPNFYQIRGDATALSQIKDHQFDLAFSNSVIEHVGDFEAQSRMAKEVQRIAPYYFLQTPNYFFPLEPHFHFPGFQWLPNQTRIWLMMHFSLGWHKKIIEIKNAEALINHNRLMRKKELESLFPNAKIIPEKILGLVKSFIVTNIDFCPSKSFSLGIKSSILDR
jgi:hypothetical protein